ncbi:Gag-Pro-Pol polyprotein [Merluccius polli]|uniref:ribonuclease H n=1 Tax=Merluccius polli TaxID=89951 RepID=A0AA47M2P3_MERPO|nr:Gag-Pro-Pol polyprotein [Merluccius polli]
MALSNLLDPGESEQYKYHLLLDHLKVDQARRLALAYVHAQDPYTQAIQALDERYGQPRQLALRELRAIMEMPAIRIGDGRGLDQFSLRVQALVGLLQSMGREGLSELTCGSHVERLLEKLPSEQFCQFKRSMSWSRPGPLSYNLLDFSSWLQREARCQPRREGSLQSVRPRPPPSHPFRAAAILHGSKTSPQVTSPTVQIAPPRVSQLSPNTSSIRCPVCAYCNCPEHHVSKCDDFLQLTKDQRTSWIKEQKRCWRCARDHFANQCDLKGRCNQCNGKHLQVLCNINQRQVQNFYLDHPSDCNKVLLKVVDVTLRNGNKSLDTYAILDDGSERTILLHPAAQKLQLMGEPESLTLRTVRQDVQTLNGATVSFTLIPKAHPDKSYAIRHAFTADQLSLSEHSHPVKSLQRRYAHLRQIPLKQHDRVSPLLLIGADHTHLITPTWPVKLGPPGAPAAIKTRLGWTLQGPARDIVSSPTTKCHHISFTCPPDDIPHNVQKLWQLDTLPPRNTKMVVRSKQDQDAIHQLEIQTTRIPVDGVLRYATPLLRAEPWLPLKAPKEAAMSRLRSCERRLLQSPTQAKTYTKEIQKLVDARYVKKLSSSEVADVPESWYIPHQLVRHNGKDRIVFDCSFSYQNQCLNSQLLPGPTLGPSLLGVLLRFRQHKIAISGDIKSMFHQVRLLPQDKPLLRFLWRDLDSRSPPTVYEWQVIPFGTTSSPCCAIYTLHRIAKDAQVDERITHSIHQCFYVDNCLQSFPTPEEAKDLLHCLCTTLSSGGYEIRQWASNDPTVICDLPPDARSDQAELWLSHHPSLDPMESTLGLHWNCHTDTLKYKHRVIEATTPTMRHIYRVLASQYDPLGYILPYTTRAKIIVQHLWAKAREWDDPNLPHNILEAWLSWEGELPNLSNVILPRCLTPQTDPSSANQDLHIFCDASAQSYGAVAYMRTDDGQQVNVSFLMARSRVAPKKQLSIPRLELCAALIGAQLLNLLQAELTLNIRQATSWSDSTTVLYWLLSDSCRYKVFVGTRVAEIQELTKGQEWRYVDSQNNPADDLTRGKQLSDLAKPCRWNQGPAFLLQPPDLWPRSPTIDQSDDPVELSKPSFCGAVFLGQTHSITDPTQFTTFQDLLDSTAASCHGVAKPLATPSAETYLDAEIAILRQAQLDSFGNDLACLQTHKPLPNSSRLLSLAPELDPVSGLIRVGGRLRQSSDLPPDAMHPVVLDPAHPISKLLIKDCDDHLHHPGPERLFAELRRRFWILRGREAVRKHQHRCAKCQLSRAKPLIPQMADLPPARLRLCEPPFYSTGIDCFGPYTVKTGRRVEKRWGIIFKCMTTRCVHVDLLSHMNTDSFLMALRRFIARRGKPFELLSDRGTNFIGGTRELQEAYQSMTPDLQAILAKQRISFKFNPPHAPHFGGTWEREIRSIKIALQTTLGAQAVTEEVLRTVMIEIEGILNSKPLGYVSSDIADPDPVTPNLLLMGRHDSSLPLVTYPDSELRSRRQWRHSQILSDHFWAHFLRNYLPSLQPRQKWRTDNPDLQLNTVVLVLDPQLPRSLWPLGKVTSLHPGKDGRCRVADVQVGDKQYTRPVARLIPLPALPEPP